MAYGTKPTQMRLVKADLDHLEEIRETEGLPDRTATVRFLMGYYERVEADERFSIAQRKKSRKKSSVAT
jgi:hypothetical protein